MKLFTPLVIGALMIVASPDPASSQARARGSARVEGQAAPRGSAAPAPAPSQGAAAGQRQPVAGGRSAPRQATPRQFGAAQAPPPVVRQPGPSAARVDRPVLTGVPPARRTEFPSATAVPRSVPRTVAPRQVVIPPSSVVTSQRVEVYRGGRRGYWPDYRVRNYYDRPGYISVHRFARPYYTFRPRVRIGFGLWVGYPVVYPYPIHAYTYAYPYPYAYAYPPAYTYPYGTPPYPVTGNPLPQTTAPVPDAVGGLSFDINPQDADLFIDGQYVGIVGQFSSDQPPLWLSPGRHRIEIREPGYETVIFDVDIVVGQVIPYQGDLRRF